MTLEVTLIVTVEDDVAGFVPNVPVIPAGQFDAASVTAELNPLEGVIVTVEVPADPATAVAAAAVIVNEGAALTVSAMLAVVESVPLAPVTVSV